MQCFIVGADDKAWAVLAPFVETLGLSPALSADFATLREDKRLANAPRSLILLSETASRPLNLVEAADFAREMGGQAFVVCVADAVAPDAYKHLVRTGAAEWVTWRDHREELGDIIARLGAEIAPGRSAMILSCLPSKGGVGNTTLAVEIATHLSTRRRRGGSRVAILDLNLQGGTVADALDIEPRFDVTEVMDRPERLDEQLIDVFTSHYSKSLDVFASPVSRIGLNTIKPEVIFTVIDLIASRYDVVLFDLPTIWSTWTDTLLQGSDIVIVSGGDTVPALRRLTATLDHVDKLSISDAKLAAVVNAVDTNLLGQVARKGVIEKALAKRRIFLVRRDGPSAAKALDVGRPLLSVASGSGLARDVRRVTDWVEATMARTRPPHPAAAPVQKAFA